MISVPTVTRLFNKSRFKPMDFLYCLVFVAVPLAIVAVLTLGAIRSYLEYAGMMLASAAVIFFVRSVISAASEIKLNYKPWFTGLVFSAVATLIVSVLAGIPIPIPLMNASVYERARTIRGMKRGEVKNKEKWETSMFSFIAILAFAQLFTHLGGAYGQQPLFYAGVMLTTYVLVDMLPFRRLNGAFMAYHNTVFYVISAAFVTVIFITSYISREASLIVFLAFLAVSLISYKVKLW